ncbi:MAG: hypothetical protein NZ942_00365 [Candidatus Aenigmarchaeota archaeon]|nr:hypothetical protein [Candidatus Aenigmarchaeota archaeon]
MKIRLNKITIVGLILIFLMVGSSIMIGIERFLSPTAFTIKLPEKNIIDYELGINEEKYLLERGITIVKAYFPRNCIDCLETKNYLENFVIQNSNQVIMQELESNLTKVIIRSYRGQVILENATQEEIFESFCELMLQPPANCVLKGLT